MTAVLSGTNGLLQSYDYQVLTTGFSYTFAAGTQVLVINPAGTLATGTITMPAAPADGMTITFSSTQTITALTVSANTGQSINNAMTTFSAGQVATYIYRSASTAWFPFASDSMSSIGYGQTWQSFTYGTQRVSGTTYTNSTGRPIAINFRSNTGAGTNAQLTIGGVLFAQSSGDTTNGGAQSQLYALIPNGVTYSITSTRTNNFWFELR